VCSFTRKVPLDKKGIIEIEKSLKPLEEKKKGFFRKWLSRADHRTKRGKEVGRTGQLSGGGVVTENQGSSRDKRENRKNFQIRGAGN